VARPESSRKFKLNPSRTRSARNQVPAHALSSFGLVHDARLDDNDEVTSSSQPDLEELLIISLSCMTLMKFTWISLAIVTTETAKGEKISVG